jgi:hypothetical protein
MHRKRRMAWSFVDPPHPPPSTSPPCPGVLIRRIPLPRPHQCPVVREPPVVSCAHTATPAPPSADPVAGQVRSLCVTGVALPFLCGMKPHFVSHKFTCGSEVPHNRHPVYKWVLHRGFDIRNRACWYQNTHNRSPSVRTIRRGKT